MTQIVFNSAAIAAAQAGAMAAMQRQATPNSLAYSPPGHHPSSASASGLEAKGCMTMLPTKATTPEVLLVEDNPINQVVALEFLALMGVQTRLANNGLEALSACGLAAPDLVLMDIQMPGMDGLECTRRLRELQAAGTLAPFPILALTAHALDSDVQASMEAGMDEHLTKPLDFKSLRNHLGRWVKLPE